MRYLAIRSQLVLVSVMLFLIFAMMMGIVNRFNVRWDFTAEKIYSLSEATDRLLKEMSEETLDIIAFYPHEDPARGNFEVFLKQCRMSHGKFRYSFFDPDRVPSKAKEYDVKENYTVIIQYKDLREKIVQPTEQSFTNALFRLLNPKKLDLCFVTGHGEAALERQDRNGFWSFNELLKSNNYNIHEIILSRDQVPAQCPVVIVAGPHRDFDPEEFKILQEAFIRGVGVFFLIDPMDAGTGRIFKEYFKYFGIELGEDVIVDKVSRMVGGDFLVPLVGQYVTPHPITNGFDKPTFFPVARSVQAGSALPSGIDAVSLAVTGSGSWAETNLNQLENGEAVFESESDLLGPISIAAAAEGVPAAKAVEQAAMNTPPSPDQAGKISEPPVTAAPQSPATGRMVVVGDSDFLTNAYLELSGNADLALNIIQWLSKDDRFIKVRPRQESFKPHLLNAAQRLTLTTSLMVVFPALILLLGLLGIFLRKRNS